MHFLFDVTLERPDLSRLLVLAHSLRKLLDVLSADEVAKLLGAAPGIKYRTPLSVAYGVGLRVRKVAHLQLPPFAHDGLEAALSQQDLTALLS